MEEWHTLTHDIELLTHPETPVFKEGQVPSEAELHELLRLRRMERQPELAVQLDEIANWLHDLLGKKGEKDVQGIVRAINKRCNDWFKVLQRRWPQHKDRHGSVKAFLQSRPMMFRFIIEGSAKEGIQYDFGGSTMTRELRTCLLYTSPSPRDRG